MDLEIKTIVCPVKSKESSCEFRYWNENITSFLKVLIAHHVSGEILKKRKMEENWFDSFTFVSTGLSVFLDIAFQDYNK